MIWSLFFNNSKENTKYFGLRDWKNPAEKWILNRTSLKNRKKKKQNDEVTFYLQPGEFAAWEGYNN